MERETILLVSCYELGHQPQALASPLAFLERAGYAAEALDISVEPFESARFARARLVAISVPMHTALRLGVAVARRVRSLNPTCHVAFYGLYATLNASHLLEGIADSVMSGEIETSLVDLVHSLERSGHVVTAAEPLRVLAKLDFPVPSRASLPSLKKYAHLERNGGLELVGYVEASRGCKHLCRHCPIPPVYGGRFFVVPIEVLLADVRQQADAGATHITFGDPDFLNGPGHALAVARALHAEFPALTFDFTAKVEHLLRHRDRLAELARMGCAFIVSAAESLSDAVLSNLHKGHTRADIETAIRLTAEAGITLRPTWVAFTPWTTLGDYRELLDFVEERGLVDAVDPVQYSIRLLVPPGSLLLERPAMRPFLGELVEEQFYYRWTHPDPCMEALHAEVAALVAGAADRWEDAALTFQRIRELADRTAGLAARPVSPLDSKRRRPPRLTEPWFC